MAKINSLKFRFFLIIFLLIQTTLQDDSEWITFVKEEGKVHKEYTNVENAKRFAVEFKNQAGSYYDGPNYLKIEVSSKSAPAPRLCFSNTDPWCEERLVLSKNPNGNSVYIWARKEQYEEKDNEPYFVVSCPDDTCTYNVDISGDSLATIKPNEIYSYLVTNKNNEMQFKLTDMTQPRISICIEGSETAELEFGYEGVSAIGYVKCVNVLKPDEEDENFGIFKIKKASENDYITLSVIEYNVTTEDTTPDIHYGRVAEGVAMPNGNQITSLIYFGHTSEQCFKITKETLSKASNTLYITGKVHSKYLWFFLEEEDGTYIESTDTEVLDGQLSFVFNNEKKTRLICFEVPTDDNFKQSIVMFSFQIIDYPNRINLFEYTHPQISGQVYRRLLPQDTISYFYVAKTTLGKEKYDYTLSNIKGTAKLYISDKCEDFPDCHYEKKDLDALNKTVPVKINNQMIWKADYDTSSALSIKNNLMIVYCEPDSKSDYDYCEFETSILYKGQDITLVEKQKFFKFILKGESGNIYIDLKDNRIFQLLTVDIMIFSGDVTFTVEKPKEEDDPVADDDIKYYYLSNKILINLYRPRKSLKKLVIKYRGNLNSFFDIKYTVDSINSEQYEEYLNSSESYLIQINPSLKSKTKQIFMKNYYNSHSPFLINFFSLNCEFEINNVISKNPVTISDGYAQEYFKAGEGFDKDEYDYNYVYDIKVKQKDPSNKMCAMYVAGVELEPKYDREIVVAANINQQIIFDNVFKKVKFTYPISDTYKDITYHVNVIDKAYYKLNGYINGLKMYQIENKTITTTTTYFLYAEEIREYCKIKDSLCIFSLVVEYAGKIIEGTNNPMIEITFREPKNVPTYLQKGNAKLDYVCGDILYYLYTDIGQGDEAEVTLNFWREFGYIWAKVVKKDLKVAEPEANWREMYRMPGPKWEDTLPYDKYTKKLKVKPEDTKDCSNGCYLLMTIQINDVGTYVPDHYYYFFTILAKITPSEKSYNDLPKVVMQVDEYIIGSLNTTELDDRYCSDFYEIWLPHDADTVEFDWQSTLANLYINVGGSRPSTKNPDFILNTPGKHSVLSLKKEDILEKARKRNITTDTLQDINLVIGVWTDKKDSVKTELYSLRIHEPEIGDKLEILPVHADQKIMCKPKEVKIGLKNYYRCYFMIMYDTDIANFNPLYVYGESVYPGADIDIYGNLIKRDIYDSYNEEELKKNLPTSENANYNSYNEGVDYIYIQTIPSDYSSYLFITLESDTSDELMLINSIPIYEPSDENTIVYPNSFTEQIYSCKGKVLKMDFPGDEGLSVVINVLAGEAEIHWEKSTDIYKVKGVGDKINLLTEKTTRTLLIRNTKPIELNKKLGDKMEDPGFLFYITYKPRAEGKNFDEIDFGISTEFAYRNTKLPVVVYSRMEAGYEDLNIAISFKDFAMQSFGDYAIYPIIMRASILSEESVIKAKKNEKDIVPSNLKGGKYDPATQTALLYLSKEEIQQYNIAENDNPTVYIRLDQVYSESSENSQFNVEVQINGISGNANKENPIPVEKIYHFGTLGQEREVVIYPLKLVKKKMFVRVQIAFNSPNLDFCLNTKKDERKNQTFGYTNKSKKSGKIYFTFMKDNDNDRIIYLMIFRKKQGKEESFQSNYVFKYINADSETEFFDYPVMYPELVMKEEADPDDSSQKVIKVSFNQIHPEHGEANITYSLKIVDNYTYRYEEEINTIAVTESFPIRMVYERNPEAVEDKITLTARGYLSNWAVINVIAQIQQKNIIEYATYNGILEIRPYNGDDGNKSDPEESNNAVLFGVIGGVLAVIAIVLIIVIIIFQRKNKTLMNQVKHVSFQKTNSGTDPNLLLQKPEDPINSA